MFIAHRREDTGEEQTLRAHCEETAALASGYAIEPLKQVVEIGSLLHDAGKYQPTVQERLRGKDVRAPHAFVGAQVVQKRYKLGCGGLMMAYAIAGHHAGLPDFGGKADAPEDPTLNGNLCRPAEDYAAYDKELDPPPLNERALQAYLGQDCRSPADASEKFAFFTRYLFSCLTDADSLNTERFCGGVREPLTADFAACLQSVNQRLRGFVNETALQRARAELQAQAFAQADTAAQVYLMNMPTGSGKTLCSLKFALERALRAGKKRIIYVIPYNSIIDQTAKEFAAVLGANAAILRHQSTYAIEDDEALADEEKLARTKATENWDAPVIVTTVVQFFESLYGDRRSKLRRLHNMQDAVLVFDEAHLLPREFLQPCLKGVAFLTRYLGSEAVLLTATMPDYRSLLERFGMPGLRVTDLVPDRAGFAIFRKCRYVPLGAISDAALLERAQACRSCLVVVNSRKTARALYNACASMRKRHLSTWMTALDRQRVIDEVKAELQATRQPDAPVGEPLIVFSTSLIEAGVDMDFDCVMRELTGLDSILQSGGRCNREGRSASADVFVFEREDAIGKPRPDARVSITRALLRDYDSIDSPECVAAYYDRLYAAHEDELESRSIVTFAKEQGVYDPKMPLGLPFRSYSAKFRMIDAPTYSIAVARDDKSRALIARIPYGLTVKELRSLQPYCCSVTRWDFDALRKNGVVSVGENGLCWLALESAYEPDTGIQFECADIQL